MREPNIQERVSVLEDELALLGSVIDTQARELWAALAKLESRLQAQQSKPIAHVEKSK